MAVFPKIMTISTDLNGISSFVPNYWLNWQILVAILFILYLLILFIFYLYLYYIYYGYFIYIIFTYIIYILFIFILYLLWLFYLYYIYLYYLYFIYIYIIFIMAILFILYLRLRNSFKKFYGRYPDLIGKYQRLVKNMVADSFPD